MEDLPCGMLCIPVELIDLIIDFCNYADQLSMSQVCRQYRQLSLRYIFRRYSFDRLIDFYMHPYPDLIRDLIVVPSVDTVKSFDMIAKEICKMHLKSLDVTLQDIRGYEDKFSHIGEIICYNFPDYNGNIKSGDSTKLIKCFSKKEKYETIKGLVDDGVPTIIYDTGACGVTYHVRKFRTSRYHVKDLMDCFDHATGERIQYIRPLWSDEMVANDPPSLIDEGYDLLDDTLTKQKWTDKNLTMWNFIVRHYTFVYFTGRYDHIIGDYV